MCSTQTCAIIIWPNTDVYDAHHSLLHQEVFIVNIAAKTLLTLSLHRCLGHWVYHTQHLSPLTFKGVQRVKVSYGHSVFSRGKSKPQCLKFGLRPLLLETTGASCHTSTFSIGKHGIEAVLALSFTWSNRTLIAFLSSSSILMVPPKCL